MADSGHFKLSDLDRALLGLNLNQQRLNRLGSYTDVHKVPKEVCVAICEPWEGWQVNAPYRLVRCRHGFSLSFKEVDGKDELNIMFLKIQHGNYIKMQEGKNVN